ncbi:DUF3107 domain-containing protein [Microbacterium sp. Marseille-Q6965]|uniref:DUF3107 domain-containing protein n=1 Tax=Microbacterium sp. Marseille-Q6965 TaxID=2965072 RepID=UPI0021B841A2|nr:DUF3107 domain-containing protein [Microbacterium sp. Marseille-Q6965]
MEIRIGITNSGRELSFESSESAETVRQTVATALKDGTMHIELTDTKGTTYLVPVANLAYVEIGSEGKRPVGFVS